MRGKYSPTVFHSYHSDPKWFEKNGGGFGNGNNTESDLDNDGFDSYGYSNEDGSGVDRAGYFENDYVLDENLFDQITEEWFTRKIIK